MLPAFKWKAERSMRGSLFSLVYFPWYPRWYRAWCHRSGTIQYGSCWEDWLLALCNARLGDVSGWAETKGTGHLYTWRWCHLIGSHSHASAATFRFLKKVHYLALVSEIFLESHSQLGPFTPQVFFKKLLKQFTSSSVLHSEVAQWLSPKTLTHSTIMFY